MAYWPQLLAFLLALGGCIGINFIVSVLARVIGKTSRWKRVVPALPGLIGAATAMGVWPGILRLASTGLPALEKIPWHKYEVIMVLLGVAQGAIASNIYKFFMQSFLGKDGMIEDALRKKLGVPKDDAETP